MRLQAKSYFAVRGIFSSNYYKLNKHVFLLLNNYTNYSNYFGSRRCTHHLLETFNHVFVLSFNVFLFNLWFFYRWSTGNFPLWLFWLVWFWFWNSEKDLAIFEKSFLKMDSTVRYNCGVMSHHTAYMDTCFALIGWSLIFSNWTCWKQTTCIQFFLNLDTCKASIHWASDLLTPFDSIWHHLPASDTICQSFETQRKCRYEALLVHNFFLDLLHYIDRYMYFGIVFLLFHYKFATVYRV